MVLLLLLRVRFPVLVMPPDTVSTESSPAPVALLERVVPPLFTANAGAGSISGFSVGEDGSLALLDASGSAASLGATSHPLDEAISGNGQYLYNLTDGAHAISAFRIAEDGSLAPAGAIAVPAGAVGLAAR